MGRKPGMDPAVADGASPAPTRNPAHDDRLVDPALIGRAILDAFRKLNPARQIRNPVMFVVEVGAALTTVLGVQALAGHGEAGTGFILSVTAWLWFTVVFANFAEAMAEGRGKAQADALRRTRHDVTAKRLPRPDPGAAYQLTPASDLRKGHFVLVESGDLIPSDGDVVEGVASVDELSLIHI